jgi:UDP-glucose 4-epimerase
MGIAWQRRLSRPARRNVYCESRGSKNVLTAAGEFDIENVVLASSCNNYGRAASTDIDNETEQNPISPYAGSEVTAE